MSDRMFTVSINAESLLARLRGYTPRLYANLFHTITRLAITVQAAVKDTKLSGQVLHVRTGTLRRSINQEVKATPGSIMGIVGTNVPYGAVHEFGFKGVVTVREHLRRVREGTRTFSSIVRAHPRAVNLPERSFLRSSLKDLEAQIKKDIGDAALQALRA